MEDINAPIFAQAKVEYTKQLVEVLYSHMFDGFKSIYDESRVIHSLRSGQPILILFRELLEKVPIWNSDIIDSECSRIINNSGCDWIDDLITAVFISHTKILTSIGPNQSFQKINITIPKTSTFIHKSYINSARELWKNPYLFNETVPAHEYQKNNKEVETIIQQCIEKTIRNLLPIKEILREHLEGENDSIVNQKAEMKKLLREELASLKIGQTQSGNNDTDVLDKDSPDTDVPDTDVPDTDVPDTDVPDTDVPDTDVPDTDVPDSIADTEDVCEELPTRPYVGPQIIRELDIVPDDIPGVSDAPDVHDDPDEDDNDDPSEAQINSQCSGIIVNDTTLPVDIGDKGAPVKEEIYDRVDLRPLDTMSAEKDDPVRLKRLMTNMQVVEEVSVIKSTEIARSDPEDINPFSPQPPPPQPQTPLPIRPESMFSLSSLYPNMVVSKSPENTLSEVNEVKSPVPELSISVKKDETVPSPDKPSSDKPVPDKPSPDKPVPEAPKSPRKEIVVIHGDNDIDDTSSMANFFNDIKSIAEHKGIVVETNKDSNFTLFEDANEIEAR
jgi:hypothetical protein